MYIYISLSIYLSLSIYKYFSLSLYIYISLSIYIYICIYGGQALPSGGLWRKRLLPAPAPERGRDLMMIMKNSSNEQS